MNTLQKTTLCLLLLLVTAGSARADSPAEHYLRFQVDNPKELNQISLIISIARVQGDTVYAFASDSELAAFDSQDYNYTLLPHPSSTISPRMAATASTAAEAWDSYPTYSAYVAMMNQFELDYPAICRIVSAGTTVNGREILFAVISDNINAEEDEPEVMQTSSMHGNETAGYVLMLRLIDSLLVSYGTDPGITRLVDSCEIWINPLANPDGTYRTSDSSVSGATRANANGVDINRNFPDPAAGPHPDGQLWQPETIAMMNLALAHSFTLSVNYHGGTEVVNYPWDTWSRRHPDDTWYRDISHLYADTAQLYSAVSYMSGFNDGITNGYDWYRITGGRQDYMTYDRRGRELTIELSFDFILPAAQLPAYWTYNRASFLDYMENSLYGVRGIVTDAVTSLPIAATISVLGHDKDNSQVLTDPDVGDYHRMIEAGTYNLVFSADGYFADTVYGVTAVDQQSTTVNAALTPLPNAPYLAVSDFGAEGIQAGDTVAANILVQNLGLQPATNISGTLVTSDPFVSITQSASSFVDLDELGDSALSDVAFQFVVSPTCPFDHHAAFELILGADGGYLDTTVFTVTLGLPVEDFETAGFASFDWQAAGGSNWTIEDGDVFEGSYAARSGSISDNQYSELYVDADVTAAGTLSFHCKVSSEDGWDYLTFWIDGQEQDAWSGEVDWTKASYPIDAGPHTFAWRYEKDANTSAGLDRALVDFIVFPPISSELAIYATSLPDWTVGQPYSQQLTTVGGTAPFTWSDLSGDLTGSGLTLSSAGLLSGTPATIGTVQFTAEVTDAALGSDQRLLALTVNDLPTVATDSIPPATTDQSFEFQLLASDGTPPFSWTDRDGDLVGTGLSLSSDGWLTGIPTSGGTILLTARLEDVAGAVDEKAFSFDVTTSCCFGIQGNINCDPEQIVDITDVQVLIDNQFLTLTPLCCFEEADLDQNGEVDITDLSILIDNQFLTLTPLLSCP